VPAGINTLTKFFLACVLAGNTVALPIPSLAAERKVALVIGNSAYPTARLRNPVNDATAMAEKLRTLGFDVILRTNATQRDMSRAISEFGKKVTLGSVSLFYFAGHGMQVRGKNFLIPVDAEIESEGAVRGEAVDVEHVLDQLGPAQLSMIILDACRDNPFETRFRRVGGGLAQIDAPTGSLLAYATAPGKVAADGAGSNGLYTAALLKAIDMPGLKIEDIFKQVRNEVLKASENRQIPWESSSLTAEFYFRPSTTAQIENARLQQSEKERAELLKEMEKLRAEMLKLRETTLATAGVTTPVNTPATAPSPMVATAPTNSRPATSEVPTIAPTPLAPTSGEWAQRLAQLEKARGQLTLSRAMALLLDIDSAEELSLLLTLEAEIKRKVWNNSYAMGTDSNGSLIWGGGFGLRSPSDAADTALEQCSAGAGSFCKLVVLNGEFQDTGFIEFAKLLGARDIAVARRQFMNSLAERPVETAVGSSAGRSGTQGGWAMGYASPRK
jgi:hypothetical protein